MIISPPIPHRFLPTARAIREAMYLPCLYSTFYIKTKQNASDFKSSGNTFTGNNGKKSEWRVANGEWEGSEWRVEVHDSLLAN